jgi:hypothetical protein
MNKPIELKNGTHYIIAYPPSASSYGVLLGNLHRIPEDWVKAGEKIVNTRTCERKSVYCPLEFKEQVIEEIINPSVQAARDYKPASWE